MQIKAALRFHLQSERPRSIKHATAHADKGSGAKGKVTLRRWASERVQPLWESLLTLPWKLGLDPPQDPAVPLVGRDASVPTIAAALYFLSQKEENTYLPVHRRVDDENGVHLHNGAVSSF